MKQRATEAWINKRNINRSRRLGRNDKTGTNNRETSNYTINNNGRT